MSIHATTVVWRGSKQKGYGKLLMLAIADYANDDCTGAYPSMARLAQKTGMSERNVRRLLVRLEQNGELIVHHNAGPRGANIYDIAVPGSGIGGLEGSAEPPLPMDNNDAASGHISATRTICPADKLSGSDAGDPDSQGADPDSPGIPTRTQESAYTSRTVNRNRQIPAAIVDQLFDQWWALMLRKQHKKEARGLFDVALRQTDFETLMAAARRRAELDKDEDRVKEPSSLLHERFWLGKGDARQQSEPEPPARSVEKVPRLEVTASAKEQARFAKAMEVLFKQVGEFLFQKWLSDLVLIHGDATAWTIAAPSRFIRDWVAPRYSDSIRAASGHQVEIVIGAVGGKQCRANYNL